MKILAVTQPQTTHNIAAGRTLYNKVEPQIEALADAALLKDRKPFFLPGWAGQTDCAAMIAVRVCRLGKTVPQRFAHRYWDAATLAADFTARGLLRQLISQGRPWDTARSFDASTAIGQWTDKQELESLRPLAYRLDISGTTAQAGTEAGLLWTIDEAISRVSQYYTLRTGDIILAGTADTPADIHIDDHIDGWLAGRKVLDFNCK